MRYISALFILPWLAIPALADDAPPPKHQRMTWEQRFEQANAAHDGHLTLEEAQAGYKSIARHFKDIDTDGKGYVTENDVRAWHALQRAARRRTQEDDPLRPRPAYQRMTGEQRTMNDLPAQPACYRADAAVTADPAPAAH